MTKKPELLSPAGDYNSFVSAISAGADAVYLSGVKFGARAYAKNFSDADLIKAIDYAHIFGKKIYLTVNTLLKDSEKDELFDYILPLYKAGLDAVIVQDMGVISYLRRTFPDLLIHASTQLAITGVEGIKLLEKEGVKRTVLARELTLDEIKTIKTSSDSELETFIHGALCYSYSGKCLFSSLAGGRSGNRGRCAGPCRQPYNDDKYLLSTKDICCLKILPDLIDVGIDCFKIEGRMKSADYAYGVTQIYRKYIDLYCDNIEMTDTATSDKIKSDKKSSDKNDKDFDKNSDKNSNKDIIRKAFFNSEEFKNDENTLINLYTRGGNSLGYYFKHNGKDMISLKDASYKSEKDSISDKKSDHFCKKIKIYGHITIKPDEEICLNICDRLSIKGAKALNATNRPIDSKSVIKQIDRVKDTEFEFENITCDISDNAFVKVSDLNDVRRKAVNLYRDYLLKDFRRDYKYLNDNNTGINQNKNENNIYSPKRVISCEILKASQINEVIKHPFINRIYVPVSAIKDNYKIVINGIKKSGKEVYIKFQSVIRYNYLYRNRDFLSKLLDITDGVLCDCHEVLYFLKENKFEKPIIGDVHIYALNNEAVNKYKELGFDNLTVPLELNRNELIKRNIKGEELIVYGHMPMMVSAQCLNNTLNGCDKSNKEINIKDRNNKVFTAVNDCKTCTSTIYNNVPHIITSDDNIFDKIYPKSLRIVFTKESNKRINEILDFFYKDLVSGKGDFSSVFKDNTYTKGHFNRGVL